MTSIKIALRNLNFGSSVAEFDQQLERYFVETQPFYEIINNQKDIVAGDKGTGKTAMFRFLHKHYLNYRELKNTIVIPAFNPTGSPIFQSLTEKGVLEEGEYNRLWKAFFLSLVGNWILKFNKVRPKSKLAHLDHLLRGLELRSETEAPKPIFDRVLERVGHLFH